MVVEQAWSRWQRPRPTPVQLRQDIWLALAMVVGAAAMTVLISSMGAHAFGTAPSLGEQFVWGAALALPLVIRRRFPIVALIAVGAVFIAGQARQVGDNFAPSVALFLAFYSVGAWERNRTAARWARIGVIVAMFGWLAYGLVLSLFQPSGPFSGAAGPLDPVLASMLHGIGVNILYFFAAYFFGNLAWLSVRRQAELEQRAEQLRESQEQNTRGAIVAERVRIARDLHDVVAHHVSVMGVQAGAARRVLDTDHEMARAALQTVEQTARTAIGELRGLLGVLRNDSDTVERPAETHSSPDLEQLPELVARAESAGLKVDYGVYGEPQPVPAGVALSAYRIVQEALTNVVKHAGAQQVDLRVRYLDSELEIEVTDDGHVKPADGNGFGLLGMRERIAVHGGELEAGPRRDGGYRVRAAFPIRATVDSEVS